MYQDLHFYILLDPKQYAENGKAYLNELSVLVKYARAHHARLFYFKEQIDKIKQADPDFDKGHIMSMANMLDVLLRDAIPAKKQPHLFNIHYHEDGSYLQPVEPSGINAHPHISVLHKKQHPYTEHVLRLTQTAPPALIHLNFHSSHINMMNWIVGLFPRNFNLSDKHGENGKGNWPHESVLLCSASDAQSLLNTAVPSTKFKDKLYNFDTAHQKFIELYYEGDNPQHQWHGFHVAEKDIRRVPDDIRKYFSK